MQDFFKVEGVESMTGEGKSPQAWRREGSGQFELSLVTTVTKWIVFP